MRSFFGRGEQKRNDTNGSVSSSRSRHLRVMIEKRCLSPLSMDESDDENAVNCNDRVVPRRYSFSYHKLPPKLFKLSVLKLDGSVFDVNIGRNATVAELKQAVEDVFTSSPKEGQSKISWLHVWGHFCLSYEGQKLLNDKACIRNLGIKDGDQLQFVRHMSINYSNPKRQFKIQNAAPKPCPMLSYGTDAPEEKEQKHKDTVNESGNKENQENNSKHHGEEEEEVPISEFKLAHFLKGWLSYSRLWGASRKGSPAQTNSNRLSRFASPRIGSTPKMIELQG